MSKPSWTSLDPEAQQRIISQLPAYQTKEELAAWLRTQGVEPTEEELRSFGGEM